MAVRTAVTHKEIALTEIALMEIALKEATLMEATLMKAALMEAAITPVIPIWVSLTCEYYLFLRLQSSLFYIMCLTCTFQGDLNHL